MANTSVGNLSLSITSSVTKSVNAINKLTASLQVANTELAKMNTLTANSPITINLGKINNSVKNLETQAKQTTKAVQTMGGSLSSLKDTLMFSIGFGSLQQGIRTMTSWFTQGFTQASDFVENFNLFNVSMRSGSTSALEGDETYAKALEYQNKLNSAFKVNISETMRYQGVFKNLGNSLGLTNDASSLLSKNLTNLTLDLASLHNRTFASTFSKLQSGIVGQTKPLRDLGIDVTQQTLQPLLYEMGINKYVTELTQAEKVLLRYIAIIKQSSSAHGDFAKTIETPSNQIRIFNDQIKELQRWFGTMFIGTIGKILPYVNAFVISLKEVFKWISLAFGFKMEDWDFFVNQSGDAEDLNGIIEDTQENVESLRKSLAGFDEINNIGQEASGSAMPNIGLSDTYFTLLDQLEGYNNGLDGIKTKASEISKTFLEWLGYTTDTEGNITGIEGGFAIIASLAFDNINTFFTNMKTFTKDVAMWFDEHPDAFDALIILGTMGAIVGVGLWAIASPFNAMLLAVGAIVLFYDDIKNLWDAMTPAEQLATSLFAIALGIGAIMVALSGGIAGFSISAGMAAMLATFGTIAVLAGSVGLGDSVRRIESNYANEDSGIGGIPTQRPDYYADGGFPTSGQMFIARESGAEMVGSIGGRTAVANNDQIVQAVSQGVAQAVASVMSNGGNNTVILQVDDVELGRAVIGSINKTMKTTSLVLDI